MATFYNITLSQLSGQQADYASNLTCYNGGNIPSFKQQIGFVVAKESCWPTFRVYYRDQRPELRKFDCHVIVDGKENLTDVSQFFFCVCSPNWDGRECDIERPGFNAPTKDNAVFSLPIRDTNPNAGLPFALGILIPALILILVATGVMWWYCDKRAKSKSRGSTETASPESPEVIPLNRPPIGDEFFQNIADGGPCSTCSSSRNSEESVVKMVENHKPPDAVYMETEIELCPNPGKREYV